VRAGHLVGRLGLERAPAPGGSRPPRELIADHGDIVSALPFVAPMILVVAALLFLVALLVARDRLRGDR
jgi:hypothetical protein